MAETETTTRMIPGATYKRLDHRGNVQYITLGSVVFDEAHGFHIADVQEVGMTNKRLSEEDPAFQAFTLWAVPNIVEG